MLVLIPPLVTNHLHEGITAFGRRSCEADNSILFAGEFPFGSTVDGQGYARFLCGRSEAFEPTKIKGSRTWVRQVAIFIGSNGAVENWGQDTHAIRLGMGKQNWWCVEQSALGGMA